MKITLTTNEGVILSTYPDVEMGVNFDDVKEDIETMKNHPENFKSSGVFIAPGPFGEDWEIHN